MKVDWHLDGRTLTHNTQPKQSEIFGVEVEIRGGVGWQALPRVARTLQQKTKKNWLSSAWKCLWKFRFFFGIFFDGFLIVIYSLLTLWSECIDWKIPARSRAGKISTTLYATIFVFFWFSVFGGHLNAVGGSESRLQMERSWWVDWLVERCS